MAKKITQKKTATPEDVNFDLDNIIKTLPKPATLHEEGPYAKTLSKNYVAVAMADAADLPRNTYLRYKDKEGNIRAGGKLISNDGTTIKLGKYNAAKKVNFVWPVAIDSIGTLYKYVPDEVLGGAQAAPQAAPAPQVYGAAAYGAPTYGAATYGTTTHDSEDLLSQLGEKIMLSSSNDGLASRVAELEATVTRLTEDNKKILRLIKKLFTNE